MMATERNFEFQLGEFWSVPFTSDLALTDAFVEFILNRNGVSFIALSTDTPPSYNSPYNSPFNDDFPSPTSPELVNPVELDSPPTSATFIISPDDQTTISPDSYNYEIRAEFSDGNILSLAYGKIIVQDSIFAGVSFPSNV